MIYSREELAAGLADIDWLVFGPIWLAVVIALLMAEAILAQTDTWNKRAAQAACYPLHWFIALGPFFLGLTTAIELEAGEGFAIGLVLSFLSAFATFSLLEHVHEWIWKAVRP